ncbi:MAG: alpha/beta fold hydrolase [Rhodoblastus sp.]|nr:alpha/beta fold hydrolase [Rhodoblastus sp.]
MTDENVSKTGRPDGPQVARQAILIIHGVGDQRPMDTLRSFVDAVWRHDPKGQPIERHRAWSAPDTMTDNFELFRIATGVNRGVRTDFFEFYWADLMTGTRAGAVWNWIVFQLLCRGGLEHASPGFLTARRYAWVVIPTLLTVVAFCVAHLLRMLLGTSPASWWGLLEVAVIVGFLAIEYFVKKFVGDAARYLIARPDNIGARQDIRRRGADLLGKLHDVGGYDRIVVVGHSLGTVIGYDILAYAFAKRMHDVAVPLSPEPPAEIVRIDALAEGGEFDLAAWRSAQRALFRSEEAKRWRVSDFITLGSPLTYAHFLVADDPADFDRRRRDKELATCPPQFDTNRNANSCVIFRRPGRATASIQHSALFAFTRWSNLYFPTSSGFVRGDVIGGPLAANFGAGVEDRAVRTTHLGGQSIFSHTSYWKSDGLMGSPNHIEALADALALFDETEV